MVGDVPTYSVGFEAEEAQAVRLALIFGEPPDAPPPLERAKAKLREVEKRAALPDAPMPERPVCPCPHCDKSYRQGYERAVQDARDDNAEVEASKVAPRPATPSPGKVER